MSFKEETSEIRVPLGFKEETSGHGGLLGFKEETSEIRVPLGFKEETSRHGGLLGFNEESSKCGSSPFRLFTSTLKDQVFDRSQIRQNQLRCLPRQKYYSWVPRQLSPTSPVLVVVHGISRGALAQTEAFAAYAEAYSALIVAPLFDKAGSRDYQRLGRAGYGPRSDYGLNAILDEVGHSYAVKTDQIYLWGYSAGAQFAHRYAFAYPHRIKALALGSAGWYTFPTGLDYPQGTGAIAGLPDLGFNPGRLAQTPIRVYVGERDIKRSKSLNRSRVIDRQQGKNRLQRAQQWVAQMQAFHQQQGCESQVDLELLPGVGHSFSESVRKQHLPNRIMEFFFSAAHGQDNSW